MASKKQLSVEEIYHKKTQREHILLRPDTYIGSVENVEEKMWVYDESLEKIVEKTIWYCPGFYKIFDEILVNAADHSTNNESCNKFDITIDRENNRITVRNNGDGLKVVIHKKENVYLPTLVFGHLLTGSNFNDNDERVTGGRNGYGAKLANIFSTSFIVETVDAENQKKFVQEFKDNMSIECEPKITSCKTAPYTQITFTPDLEKFGLHEITDDINALFVKRAYDLAGVCKKVTVTINGKKVKFTNFKAYFDMYYFGSSITLSDPTYVETDRWQVGAFYSPDCSYKHISFVNSVCTYHGGKHVDYIVDQIVDSVKTAVSKKKGTVVKPQGVKDNLIVFINSTIVNPTFSSQVKDNMTLLPSKFGSKCELPDKFLKSMLKSGIVEYIVDLVSHKDQMKITKKVTKNTKSLNDIIKLQDAPKAGTKEGRFCTLIITEGDSAASLAMAGLSEVDKDYYGVFPLKGKPINVREKPSAIISKNEELKNICRILGLEMGKVYDDVGSLRYGHVIIMSDQDFDGFHIKGLMMNTFHYYWPSLLKFQDFLQSFRTPVVKGYKGKQYVEFFNNNDYLAWKEENSGWNIKYFKGLGTSTNMDAKDYFSRIDELVSNYVSVECSEQDDKDDIKLLSKKSLIKNNDNDEDIVEECDCIEELDLTIKPKYKNPNTEAITLAFEKQRVRDRKVWLKQNNIETLDYTQKNVTFPDFIHKELIFFSLDDCKRSIPAIDGLKPSQRKIIFATFKKRLINGNTSKVSQLCGSITELTEYHHGEKSLTDAIVNLAQNYVGSNNMNLMEPAGQFGTRNNNGKDSAAPRYIFTGISKLSQHIFNSGDDDILEYLNEDDHDIEPRLYAPIIPITLINGADGIGTGYRCSIPKFSPYDIIEIIKNKLDGTEPNYDILPWIRGYTGTVLRSSTDPNKFLIYGKYQVIDESSIRITEIPISNMSKSPMSYKEFLNELKEKGTILSFESDLTGKTPVFIVTLDESELEKMIASKSIYAKFKLIAYENLYNIVAFDSNDILKKYNSIKEYIDEYYDWRYALYEKRKDYLIKKYTSQLEILKWKMKFIIDYNDGTITLYKVKIDDVIKQLEELEYPKLGEDDDTTPSYKYLLNITVYRMTLEEVNKLKDKIKSKNDELNIIMETSVEEQWKHELDCLLEEYEEWLKAKDIEETPKSKAPKKIPTKKVSTRKVATKKVKK